MWGWMANSTGDVQRWHFWTATSTTVRYKMPMLDWRHGVLTTVDACGHKELVLTRARLPLGTMLTNFTWKGSQINGHVNLSLAASICQPLRKIKHCPESRPCHGCAVSSS